MTSSAHTYRVWAPDAERVDLHVGVQDPRVEPMTQVDGGWYAIPRCRSAQSFYQIADAMNLAPAELTESK